MSSMDDVFERMLVFRQTLAAFSAHLNDSLSDLARHHEHVDGLWKDSTRRSYDDAWLPLEQSTESFAKQTCPNYLEFLDTKLAALDDYLHGRR